MIQFRLAPAMNCFAERNVLSEEIRAGSELAHMIARGANDIRHEVRDLADGVSGHRDIDM
jgi:hypothetical protein